MIDDSTGLILVGGQSRRMGRDKATLPVAGRTLIEQLDEQMRSIFPQVLLSVRAFRADLALPQVVDQFSDAGPAAGVCAGLAEAKTPWIFALAVDMPFLRAPVVERLASWRERGERGEERGTVDAVVPRSAGYPQPLAAFYARSALPVFQAVLCSPHGPRSLRAVLDRLRVRYIDAAEVTAEANTFIDLDTPDDLKKYGETP